MQAPNCPLPSTLMCAWQTELTDWEWIFKSSDGDHRFLWFRRILRVSTIDFRPMYYYAQSIDNFFGTPFVFCFALCAYCILICGAPFFFRFVSFFKKQLPTQRHQHMPGCGGRKWLRYYGHPGFRKANNPNPQAADSTRTRDSVSIFFSLFKRPFSCPNTIIMVVGGLQMGERATEAQTLKKGVWFLLMFACCSFCICKECINWAKNKAYLIRV